MIKYKKKRMNQKRTKKAALARLVVTQRNEKLNRMERNPLAIL